MCMGVSPPCWDRCALCDGTSSLPRARRQGYWRKRSDGWDPVCTFLHLTSAVRRQHPVAGRRDGVPHPRGGNRTTLEVPARRRDGHPQDLDSLFCSKCCPKWTIGLCAGSAFIAALSLQPTFARFRATARKQGRPFDRLGQRKSPSPESHPVRLTRFGGHPESLARGAADAKNTSTVFAGVSPADGRPRPCWT
jgi:hypothetical protein